VAENTIRTTNVNTKRVYRTYTILNRIYTVNMPKLVVDESFERVNFAKNPSI
jgi:hypothetical protein